MSPSPLRPDFSPAAEQAFVDAAVAGDPGRMRELAERLTCVRRMLVVRNRAMGFPLNGTELDDLVQDTMVTILRRLPEFRPMAPFEAWVHGICSLGLRDAVRAKRRRSSRVEPLLGATDAELATKEEASDWTAAEAILQRLGGIESDVVRLKHFEELTFDEIGVRLGIPTNTAKSHYYRGLSRLRASWPGDEEPA